MIYESQLLKHIKRTHCAPPFFLITRNTHFSSLSYPSIHTKMSKVARRPFITDVSIEKSIQILADPNVSYKLLYWDIFSVGATSRELLAFGNVKWSNERIAIASDEQDKVIGWLVRGERRDE